MKISFWGGKQNTEFQGQNSLLVFGGQNLPSTAKPTQPKAQTSTNFMSTTPSTMNGLRKRTCNKCRLKTKKNGIRREEISKKHHGKDIMSCLLGGFYQKFATSWSFRKNQRSKLLKITALKYVVPHYTSRDYRNTKL